MARGRLKRTHTLNGTRITPELRKLIWELRARTRRPIPDLVRRAVARMIESCDERKGKGLDEWLKSETSYVKWLCGEDTNG